MRRIKHYITLLVVIAVVATAAVMLCRMEEGSYSNTSIHREIKQNSNRTQVIKEDTFYLTFSTKMRAVQPLTARFLLEKGNFHIKRGNNNLIFHSFFAILFKVAIIPSNLSRILLAVIVYQLSAAGKIITLLHLADGRKKPLFF